MEEPRGSGVSRRALFGVLRRGARHLREGLDDVHRAHGGASEQRPGAPADPPASHDRLLRPPAELALATPTGPDAWAVDLKSRRLAPGDDAVVRGRGLDEPLVLVRVHDHHWAACSGECPVDGSDLRWAAADDVLRCPSCGSAWRLDGASVRGPADSALARFVVAAYEGDAGDVELRVHRP